MTRRVALVTGGAGFIGSNVVARLCRDPGLDVVVCDWLERNAAHVELVVHMGAISSTTEPDADRIVQNNYVLSRDLWNWCAEHRRRLIYASSAATYGNGALGFDDDNAMGALMALRPLNAYGWSKAAFDIHAVREAARGHAPPQWAGLKFFNVYGPNEEHKASMKSVAAQIWPDVAAGRPVRLFKSYREGVADGGQLRDFVYVRDAADVIEWLAGRPDVSGIYNLGSGRARSFREMAEAVFKAARKDPQIEYAPMPEGIRDRYQYFTEANVDRLRRAGYDGQFTSLEDGVADYVRGYLSQPDPYL